MARRGGAAALLVSALASAASAQPAREEHRVDFEARRVELADEEGELSLAGDVVVRSERFQLTADEVTLSRSPRGVHVEGSGRLAFCRCKHPPLTLGFAAADLAPPTDVLLEHATLRVFGVPVFYSPYLWLRAPTKPGALPPTFAYRGEEGVLLGSGLHLPLAAGATRPTVLDVGAHVYLSGGTRLTGDLRGSRGRASIGWDHYRGSAWNLEADFATTSARGATLAGDIDVLRGRRALIAPSAVDEVALRMDRARIGVGRVGSSIYGVSVLATSPRGSELEALPVFGPALEMGQAVALGPRTLATAFLETESLHTEDGAVALSALHAELSSARAVGPILGEIWLRERVRSLSERSRHAASFEGEARARLAMPLARRFGGWIHRIGPILEGAAAARREERGGSALLGERSLPERVTALAGLETAVGGGREAMEARVAGGLSGEPEAPKGVLAARARLDVAGLAFDTEARAVPGERAAEVFVGLEAGSAKWLRWRLHVEGRQAEAIAARRLFYDDYLEPELAWLDSPGVSAGGSLEKAWGFGLATEIGAELDLERERLLGGSAALGYRHVCDCFGLWLAGSRRVGREGFDLAVRVDLVP